MKKNFNLLKRFSILLVLCFCLGFVSVVNSSQTVLAAPCCQNCPTFNLCFNVCGNDFDCLDECYAEVDRCETICVNCSGGGSSENCLTNANCPYITGHGPGQCVGGNCVY